MEYLYFMNIFMLTRLGYLKTIERGSLNTTFGICLLQLLSLLAYEPHIRILWLAGLIILTAWLFVLTEEREMRLEGYLAVSFVVFVLAGVLFIDQSVAFAPWIEQITFSSEPTVRRWFFQVGVTGCGALFLTNEVNNFIRLMFHYLNLVPKNNQEKPAIDRTEYNAGRIIGILERNLVYIVLLAGNSYAAVGFIIAAKGFVRFKQLDQRDFAEYMLIGTLASILITLLVTSLVSTTLSHR